MASPYTTEKENFLRLVTLIHEKGLESMRETLLYTSTNNLEVKTFDEVLQTNKDRLKNLKGSGHGKPITPKQWQILYPGTGASVTVGQLDMTLCFILLRSICGLYPTLTGWDGPPAADDTSLEGGLAQLKYIRNKLSHLDNPSLSDYDFETLFQATKDAIINIAKELPKFAKNENPKWSVTEKELLRYKNSPTSLTDYHASMLSSENYNNYMKLVFLLRDKAHPVFREVLDDLSTKRHGANTFQEVLQKSTVKKILEKKKNDGKISQDMWSKLFPSPSNNMDISLCFLLLKSICGLVPKNTWDKPPLSGDRSLEGAVIRLHLIKMSLSKLKEPKISDAEFENFFKSAGVAASIFKQKRYAFNDIMTFKTLELSKLHCILSTKTALPWAKEAGNVTLVECLKTQERILNKFLEEELIEGSNFMDQLFFNLSKKITRDWRRLGLYLHIDNDVITEMYDKNHRDIQGTVLDILREWWKEAEDEKGEEDGIEELKEALTRCDYESVADNMYEEAKISIKRSKKELSEYGKKLRKRLKSFYIENMSHLCINPLDPDDTMPIESMWVTLNWVRELHETMDFTKELNSYSEIFNSEIKEGHKKGKRGAKTRPLMRILVQGKAGIGKTSFTQKLAVDWANGTVYVLKKFQTVFVLSLRDVDLQQSLVRAISEQLFSDEDVDETKLGKYIRDNDEVLLVLDGLDEMEGECSPEISKIVDRRRLTRVCTLITSRPWKAHALAKSGKKIDSHARILGFTKENRRRFIANFYANLYNLVHDSIEVCEITTKLLHEIKENDLEEIAEIPLLLNMLCLLFNDNKLLPNSISETFKTFRKWLYTRFLKKADINETDDVAENYRKTLSKLGKLALEGLLKPTPQLLFTQKELVEKVGELSFQVGLISTEKAKAKVNANTKYFFLHKSFQENTSAFLIDSEMRRGNPEPWETLKAQMTDIQGIRDKDLLLQFCAGESSQTVTQILQFLEEKLFEIEPELKDIVKPLRKLSEGEDITFQDFQTLTKQYALSYDVRQILDIQASCVMNMEEKPQCCILYHFYTFVSSMSTVSKAFYRKALTPRQCFVPLGTDEDLERVTHSRIFVSVMSFGTTDKPYRVTNNTVQFLFRIFTHSDHPICILFTRFIGEMETIINMLEVLKHKNVKNKYFGMEQCHFDPEEWREFFKCLEKNEGIIGLGFKDTNLPLLGLNFIGSVLKQNWKRFLILDIGGNKCLKGHFSMLNNHVTSITDLALVYLDLRDCVALSNTSELDIFLQKSKQLQYLNIDWCQCNLLIPEVRLKKIVHLSLCHNMEKQSGGNLDLGSILANLHKFPELKVFKAAGCCIKDKQVEMLRLADLPKMTVLDLRHNKMGEEMRSKLEREAGKIGMKDFVL